MSAIPNRTMPPASVIPVLVYADVGRASDWLCQVFGFTERWRAGHHRAQLVFGNGAVVLGEARIAKPQESAEPRESAPARPGVASHSLIVCVDDVAAHHEHARSLGATILRAPVDFPYGERQYSALDIGGHQWTFSQSIADVAPEEWGGTSSALG